MRKIAFIIGLFALASCLNLDEVAIKDENNSSAIHYSLFDITTKLKSPNSDTKYDFQGVVIKLTELNSGFEYSKECDTDGVASFRLPIGVYRASVSAQILGYQMNSSVNGIVLNKATNLDIPLSISKTGELVIKEIYCGGCSKAPEQGNYDYDNYIIIHNNSSSVQYLDGLCLGTLDPYSSTGTIVWSDDELNQFVPIIQAIWMFEGNGQSHPIQPGEDAVIALKEAINHRATYPLSVNLDKTGYYVAYNSTHFPGPTSHPIAAPGDNIAKDHILECVIKMGIANTYTISKNSPAIVLFSPIGMSINEFLKKDGVIIQKPGTTSDKIMKVPIDMVIDGVEVFNGQSATNKKRLSSAIDASYITLSNTNEGISLMRKVNKERSKKLGFEVLYDTNNSSEDFVELLEASLRNE